MIDVTKCPVCNDQNLTTFLYGTDYSISQEKFTIKKCNSCGLLITTPRPTLDNLSQYYISPNYTSHTKRAKNIVDQLYVLARKFTLKWKANLVNKYAIHSSPNRILDYGCGTGEFLNVKQNQGWQIRGIEPSPIARENANKNTKVSIHPSVNDLKPDQSFNAITLWHVLEHVPDLDETLRTLRTLLIENGTLFIAVPNYNSWDGKYYGNYWAGYDVPRHLWHFSKTSMEQLLLRNGLMLIKIIPMRLDAMYVSILSEKYQTKHPSFLNFVRGIINGIRSNISGHHSKEYSSHIYVAKKK
jgi:2-polyprenyl-3-methyl-5-hydroxy-6-metoxy-1,4-benzoquinol methylase